MEWRCVVQAKCELGEGPCWDARTGRLYWVDIRRNILHWFSPGEYGSGHCELDVMTTAVAPLASGGLLALTRDGVGVLDEAGVFTRSLALMDRRAWVRPNDGKMGRDGRFWFSTMDDREREKAGAVYSLDSDWNCVRVLDGLGIPNTLCTDIGGAALYVADSQAALVRKHRIQADGRLEPGHILFSTRAENAAPDGSAIDAKGYLWNARWGGSRIVRHAPDGTIDRAISLPVSQPTSCAFGGEGLDVLYVTSARGGLNAAELEEQPLAGSLFALATGETGLPLPLFQA